MIKYVPDTIEKSTKIDSNGENQLGRKHLLNKSYLILRQYTFDLQFRKLTSLLRVKKSEFTVYAISQNVEFYHCDFLIYRCFVHAWRMLFNKMNRCKVYICGKKSKTSRGDFSIIFLAKKNSPCNINLKKKLVLRKEFNYKDIMYHSIQKYDLLHSLSIIRNIHWDSSCNQFESI